MLTVSESLALSMSGQGLVCIYHVVSKLATGVHTFANLCNYSTLTFMLDIQVGEVGEDWFTIYLIPETLRVTVLGSKQEGDSVNLEIEAQTQVSCPRPLI